MMGFRDAGTSLKPNPLSWLTVLHLHMHLHLHLHLHLQLRLPNCSSHQRCCSLPEKALCAWDRQGFPRAYAPGLCGSPNGTRKLLSQIRTPWISNNDWELPLWIEEQPCMQMEFWQFSSNNTYVSITGKLSETDLHAWLSSGSESANWKKQAMHNATRLGGGLFWTSSCPGGLRCSLI